MKFLIYLLVAFLVSPALCLAGEVKRSTVTVFNYGSGSYRSYEIQTEGNVTEVFSYQNANTVRIEQTSPGEYEVFDYSGRGLGEFDLIEDLND